MSGPERVSTEQRRPENQIERALVYPFIGALIGTFLGVAPIALDWDRPWQVSLPTDTL